MITKPEKIIKRIIKAVGQKQSVLLIGEWDENLVTGIKENNSISISSSTEDLNDNIFTRIIVDYSLCHRSGLLQQATTAHDTTSFYKEARRLLLPTGMLIISANCKDSLLGKIFRLFKKPYIKEEVIKQINPKVLQDQIHNNGFLIDGYYGYPGNHLLMMAVIQNKNVTTLFTSEKQETVV